MTNTAIFLLLLYVCFSYGYVFTLLEGAITDGYFKDLRPEQHYAVIILYVCSPFLAPFLYGAYLAKN